MDISNFAIIFATLLGPILAVQAQKFVERAKEARSRKVQIFQILMATRATRLAPEHVQAINRIDLEFYSQMKREQTKSRSIITAHRTYLDALSQNFESSDIGLRMWNDRCEDLFIDLLFELSQYLGYSFDKIQLKRGIYHPKGHVMLEEAQEQIRKNLLAVLSGRQKIVVDIQGD